MHPRSDNVLPVAPCRNRANSRFFDTEVRGDFLLCFARRDKATDFSHVIFCKNSASISFSNGKFGVLGEVVIDRFFSLVRIIRSMYWTWCGSPSFATGNTIDSAFANAKFGGNLFTGNSPHGHFSNSDNVAFRDLVGFNALSYQARVMPNFVGFVTKVSIPPKIVEPIVTGVSIVVARFHSVRAWANKRLQHQMSNVRLLVSANPYGKIVAPCPATSWFQKMWSIHDSILTVSGAQP